MKFVISLVLLFFSLNSHALVIGSAQKFQMPAWVDRQGIKSALTVGDDVLAGDVIITGNNARVLLHINDGSDIKIGAESKFGFESASKPKVSDVFTGSFRLVTGAFRYTTNKLRDQSKRNIDINVGVISVGIRGTDVWGKSGATEDTVVLIEGDVEITKPFGSAQRLNTPLTHVVSPKKLPLSQPIPVIMDNLKAWAFETELQTGKGIVENGGKYKLHLGAYKTRSSARKLIEKLSSKGYSAIVKEYSASGPVWYRVVLENISSIQDAKYLAQAIAAFTSRNDYWISSK